MTIFAKKLGYFLPRPPRAGQCRDVIEVAKKYIAIVFDLSILRREGRAGDTITYARQRRCRETGRTTSLLGGISVKKLIALFIGMAFVAGLSGAALAQST